MKDIPRNAEASLLNDLERKFVFLSGPRQVGKTTLAKKIMAKLHGRLAIIPEGSRIVPAWQPSRPRH